MATALLPPINRVLPAPDPPSWKPAAKPASSSFDDELEKARPKPAPADSSAQAPATNATPPKAKAADNTDNKKPDDQAGDTDTAKADDTDAAKPDKTPQDATKTDAPKMPRIPKTSPQIKPRAM